MKGSNGKKKRSKEAFMLRMKQNKNKVQEVYATNKLKKWQKRGWDINKLKANE